MLDEWCGETGLVWRRGLEEEGGGVEVERDVSSLIQLRREEGRAGWLER